tara:strand:- start:211 stop:1206 length:996 start_codon:yes stop_codon:yes gene_type:complete
MIISKTPLRISFVGGGTDIPSFYKHNDYGAVLSSSINSYIYVTVKKHTSVFKEKIRLNYYDTELVYNKKDIKNTIIRECLNFLEIDDRIFIGTISDVPSSTGLGSSSSFAVGLLNALYKFKNITVPQELLAEQAAYVELDLLKSPIGKQDQYAAACGGINHFTFNSDNSVSVIPIMLNRSSIEKMFNSIITFYTGFSLPANEILKVQEKNNFKKNNIKNLIAMREQTEDLKRMLKNTKFNSREFGKIIRQGWQLKKQLNSSVSNSLIDEYISIGIKNGAYGGKISGAGGRGFLSFIADEKKHHSIKKAMLKKGLIPFKFNLDSTGATVFEV